MARKQAKASHPPHPYLHGNFAPIHKTLPLTECDYTGSIPEELLGGEYVRNGGNPVTNEDLGREAHWFDGDGMLSGVAFRRDKNGRIRPEFVNQYILTDLYLSTLASPWLKSPILPSIATLVNPASKLFWVSWRIMRAVFLVFLSHLPGPQPIIKKISVANTAIVYHDGRALATCESGPPMRVALPDLETVGWFDGVRAGGERGADQPVNLKDTLGGDSLLAFMKEWTTAHPKIDRTTGEMILFHASFKAPYVHYTIIPTEEQRTKEGPKPPRLISAGVAGISIPKMMHDFGVSKKHTVIMDLPLLFDPGNMMRGKPALEYDATKPSRFGVFPRREPSNVRWFETSACCIFHTANTWDDVDKTGKTTAVNLLACRMTTAAVVFSAGNIAAPQPTQKTEEQVSRAISFFDRYDDDFEDEHTPLLDDDQFKRGSKLESSRPRIDSLHSQLPEVPLEDDRCQLYYFDFDMSDPATNTLRHQFALSAIPLEFPSVRPDVEMTEAEFVYGCTARTSTFSAALGRASKIDGLVKFNVKRLIAEGKRRELNTPEACVDRRNVMQIINQNEAHPDEDDDIRIFSLPPDHYAQEPRFVPRKNATCEDDGYLLTYVFDESQLLPDGECPDDAYSEFWVIDARNMRDVVAKIKLPQRVPYGLHGNWFDESMVDGQREWSSVRSTDQALKAGEESKGKGEKRSRHLGWDMWMGARRGMERMLAK